MRSVLVLAAVVLTACTGSAPPQPEQPSTTSTSPETAPGPAATPPVAALPSPPWSAPAVSWAAIPRAYRTTWEAAENRTSCAAIAPATPPAAAGAPRTAHFSGGWAVAYDLPDTRSAYGVAGTGASASGEMYSGFPHRLEWSDGSIARYGPEGGTGPNQMAYLTIPGQACLYNVWSRLGIQHLEELLGSLRYVR